MCERAKYTGSMKFPGMVVLWAAVLLVTAAAQAQDTKPTGLKFARETIDVGRTAEGKDTTVEFRFVNQTGSEVTIRRIRSDCACAIAESPSKPIPPGEKSQIKVKLKTAGLPAREFVGKIAVEYAYGDEKAVVGLEVRAMIHHEGKLASDPPTLRLGQMLVGSPIISTLTVKNAVKGKGTGIREVRAPSWMKVSFEKKPDSEEWTLTVTGTAPDRKGQLRDKITVRTDSKDFPKLTIPIKGWIEGIVQAIPEVAYAVVEMKGGDRTAKCWIVDKKRRKLESVKVFGRGRFAESISSVEVRDHRTEPSVKLVVVTLKEGLPKHSTHTVNATIKAKVGEKVYDIQVSFTFVKNVVRKTRNTTRPASRPGK